MMCPYIVIHIGLQYDVSNIVIYIGLQYDVLSHKYTANSFS